MLISVDHGNKLVKTTHPHCKPFTSGLRESATPIFGADSLQYQGKHYALIDERIPYKRDKTEDERFFILTLFAIAKEIEARNAYLPTVIPVQLAIGLPPAHYGAQYRQFEAYFKDRGQVEFCYQKKQYTIEITNAVCFPQAYAAAMTMFNTLGGVQKLLVIDIGGFTADYLAIKKGVAQLGTCDSLESGVIVLYNKVKSRINADFNLLLEESDIDAILKGSGGYPADVIDQVKLEAASFVGDLFGALRERMIDLRTGKTVFIGGGSVLLRQFIENSGKVESPLFVENVCANAKGYEILYAYTMEGR